MAKTVAAYIRQAHQELTVNQVAEKRQSPWLGEIYERVCLLMAKDKATNVPDRFYVMAIARTLDIGFRVSGDYSEDYRTVYFHPTEFDHLAMKCMDSKKLAVVETIDIHKDQILMFPMEG